MDYYWCHYFLLCINYSYLHAYILLRRVPVLSDLSLCLAPVLFPSPSHVPSLAPSPQWLHWHYDGQDVLRGVKNRQHIKNKQVLQSNGPFTFAVV